MEVENHIYRPLFLLAALLSYSTSYMTDYGLGEKYHELHTH